MDTYSLFQPNLTVILRAITSKSSTIISDPTVITAFLLLYHNDQTFKLLLSSLLRFILPSREPSTNILNVNLFHDFYSFTLFPGFPPLPPSSKNLFYFIQNFQPVFRTFHKYFYLFFSQSWYEFLFPIITLFTTLTHPSRPLLVTSPLGVFTPHTLSVHLNIASFETLRSYTYVNHFPTNFPYKYRRSVFLMF